MKLIRTWRRKYPLSRVAASFMAEVVRCKSETPASRIILSRKSSRCSRMKTTNRMMMPMMANNILESIRLLSKVSVVFVDKCIDGIKADRKRSEEMIEKSLAMCTSLAPIIGYDNAAAIAKEAFTTGKTVREVAMEKKVLPEKELNKVLDPFLMTEPSN